MKGAISMKKKVILAIAVASLMMSACSTSQSATVDKTEDNNKQTSLTQKTVNEETLAVDTDSSIQREFAYELTSMGDYNKLAMDFNELVNDADMILKIKVESVTPYINENGMIQSEIVPVVEEVYKGKYNGEKLYVNGGEMLYDDFIQNDIIREQLSGHEDPDADKESLSGKYVKQTVDNQYIFHKGDEYVFFAQQREDDNKFYSLYAYQGTFKVDGDYVDNEALNASEPLASDIDTRFTTDSVIRTMSTACAEVSLEEFVNAINDVE